MFPGIEVEALDFLLGLLKRIGDQFVLNRLIFRDIETSHHRFDGVDGKNAHQRVFERNEKLGFARVALAAAATAQLVVDATGVVAFGA